MMFPSVEINSGLLTFYSDLQSVIYFVFLIDNKGDVPYKIIKQ